MIRCIVHCTPFFFLPLYCSSLLASVWCSPPSIVHCKWTLTLALALTFALSAIFTHWKSFRIHEHQAAFWWRLYQKLRRGFSLETNFSGLFPFLLFHFDILLCNFSVDQLRLTKEKCQFRSILLGKLMFPRCERGKNGVCKYVRVRCIECVNVAVAVCLCVDFSFTIVNKNTIWHRLSFNLIWRFWLFIFSSCVNSTPV